MKLTIPRGMRWLAPMAGLAGAAFGAVLAYGELSQAWNQRTAHLRFERRLKTTAMRQAIPDSAQRKTGNWNLPSLLPIRLSGQASGREASAGPPAACTMAYRSGLRGILRPVLAVRLSNGSRSIRDMALVDSGADSVFFPLSYTRALRLKLSRLPTDVVSGVGNSHNLIYYATITLSVELCGQRLSYPVTVGFTAGLDGFENQSHGLLGQDGFLDHFQVAFDRAHGQFSVKTAQ